MRTFKNIIKCNNYICLVNNCPEANCYNIALGLGETYGTETGGGNTGGYPLIAGNRLSISLDAFRIHKLDFLKIDVEGWELSVLKGAYQTLKRLHPVIHCEINPHALNMFNVKHTEVIDFLRYVGYGDFREVYRYRGEFGDHWDIIVK